LYTTRSSRLIIQTIRPSENDGLGKLADSVGRPLSLPAARYIASFLHVFI